MSVPSTDMVIVAAGASRRMGGADKLEAEILGRPLLAWTVDRMSLARSVRRLVVVVAAEQLERFRSAPWLARRGATVVAGGDERSESVFAGLKAADAPIVLVHDGARPLATPRLADAVARAAVRHGAAVPVLPVVDSLKRVARGRVAESVPRSGLARAQTPQGARRELLLRAFEAADGETFSDEAGLLESQGIEVAAVAGEALNLKVTQPDDLELVRAVAAARLAGGEPRAGTAFDSHPFGPGDGLRLGGILIEQAPQLYGHSDGDVALHALASAMLSACGLGDLGRHYPASDPATGGAASTDLLAGVLTTIEQAGWRPRSAQLSLLGARPRLGAGRLEQMRLRIAELLGLVPEAVSLSASSGNLSGAEGAGLAISASASVSLVAVAVADQS
jgi:2-C-methyl-D-erythritol 4-phosphate cytidylyltransferase / 2-C-methyl-D-erythritol 2,4-cyclodiphosphate synthase